MLIAVTPQKFHVSHIGVRVIYEIGLAVMGAARNISIEDRLRLIKKYETKSELFTRSMAFNICNIARSSNWKCGITGCFDRLTRIGNTALK